MLPENAIHPDNARQATLKRSHKLIQSTKSPEFRNRGYRTSQSSIGRGQPSFFELLDVLYETLFMNEPRILPVS